MAKKRNWIAGAIKHPGSFTRQAKGAGMSIAAFASKTLAAGSKASATTKRRARLYRTLRTIAHGG